MADFRGKVAIVTGGAGGLGAAMCRLLAAGGAKVVATDIDEQRGKALAAELGAAGLFQRQDVSDAQAWRDVVARAEAAFGPVNILINNAGIAPQTAKIDEYSEDTYRRVIEVNQLSVFLGMKYVAPSMRRAGGGSIVNMSSVAGLQAARHAVAYVASKFAITGMTKVAALDLAEDNIRVNSVHPGAIDTPMLQMPGTTPENNPVLEYLKSMPIPRPAAPEEVARVALFLASDAASFCTGGAFSADGGFTL
jgi:3alpha(or 20beta)-hydroxysteroid dehydrogenase